MLSCRPIALTMPIVTVLPIPNGLPMASTTSPTLTALVSATAVVGKWSRLIFSTARSVQGSVLNQDDFCHFWLNQGGLDGPCDKGLRIENRNDDRNGKWDGGFHDKPEKWHSETVLAIIEVRNTRRMG